MEENRRKYPSECPICHFHLLAREDDKIICLRTVCNWSISAKRETDKEIPKISELKYDYS